MNTKKPLLLLALFSAYFFTRCNISDTKRIENSIIKIEVTYLKGIFETPYCFECDSFPYAIPVNKKRIVDTVIADMSLLNQIGKELSQLTPNDSFGDTDVRLKCKIYRNNHTTDILCIGGFIGTSYNGRSFNDNQNLTFLIKYNSGYYNFCYGDEYLNLFLELKDTSKLNQASRLLYKLKSKRIEETWSDTNMVRIEFY